MPSRAELSKAAEHMDEHTPLMRAALEGDSESVKDLLAGKVDVNVKDNEGRTALMFAVINSHSDIAKALLEAGAHVNARARDGNTALMLAAMNGNAEITQLLLNEGARIGYKSPSTGKTAADLAADRGYVEIAKSLQERAAGEERNRGFD
jgi:ankyrin repeat protein